jgi:NADH-quinone oxidoreductase subunit L
LFAALIAFTQNDIKKVLAYSTVSQLGFMFLGVGMGVFWAAALHLVTHAFFKACLFLGAGSVMHGNGDETDITKLGGLRKEMKVTWLTFAIATVAITGFVVPLSGFFSKDAILHGVHSTHLHGYEWVSTVAWVMGLLSAFCTAFYMIRLYWLTFEGQRSKNAALSHAHESAWPMTLPLVVLAVLSVVALFHGVPLMPARGGGREPVMQNYLSPVFETTENLVHSQGLIEAEHGGSMAFSWGLAWVIALLGGGLSIYLYRNVFSQPGYRPATGARAGLIRFAREKFYVDELYDAVLIRPLKWTSMLLYKVIDALLIDTLAVRGTAWVTARTGAMLRYFQTGDVQSYAAIMALGLLAGAAYVVLRVLG